MSVARLPETHMPTDADGVEIRSVIGVSLFKCEQNDSSYHFRKSSITSNLSLVLPSLVLLLLLVAQCYHSGTCYVTSLR
jgi:hypothetical protein